MIFLYIAPTETRESFRAFNSRLIIGGIRGHESRATHRPCRLDRSIGSLHICNYFTLLELKREEAAEERGERVSSMRATSMIHYDTQQCSRAHFAWHKQQTGHRKTGYCTTVIQSCTTVVRRNYYRYSMGVWELVVCGCFGTVQ